MKVARIYTILLALPWLLSACALLDDSGAKKPASSGLISTPASYYSTAKAKYLGTRYKDNLDRLVERIARNPNTAPLQFANNISSFGGIGFFTHSATKTPDERYLEVVLATPETFETKGQYSEKVHQLFTRYGHDLLSILSGDGDIYQDRELDGYGLNLAWRNVVGEGAGRVIMARAIIYLPKERVRSYLRNDINQNDLLGNAVIFAEEEDAPLALISYHPENPVADFRPAIREDNLASATDAKLTRPGVQAAASKAATEKKSEQTEKADQKGERAKKESPPAKEAAAIAAVKPSRPEAKPEIQAAPVAAPKDVTPAALPETTSDALQSKDSAVVETAGAEKAAQNNAPDAAVIESKPEREIARANSLEPRVGEKAAPTQTVKPAQPPSEKPLAPKQSEAVASTKSPGDASSKAEQKEPVKKIESSKPKAVVETQKIEPEVKPPVEAVKPAIQANTPKVQVERRESEAKVEAKVPEAVGAKTPVERPAATPPKQENKNTPAPRVAAPLPVIEPPLQTATPKPPEIVTEVKARPAAKSAPPEPVTAASTKAAPVPAPAVTTQTKAAEPKLTALPSKIVSVEKDAIAREIPPVRTAMIPAEEKNLDTKAAAKAGAPVLITKPAAATPVLEEKKIAPALSGVKAETARSEIKARPPAAAPVAPPEAAREQAEQLALLKKPALEKKPITPPAAKNLEGFIIQIAFNDKEKALRWAETMERRGYAVSITEAGPEGALRVRLGNFTERDDAERQLKTFNKDGMSGIIINLPQAFKPQARSSLP